MRKKSNDGGFYRCNSNAFGFEEQMSENNSGTRKILSHFDQGLRSHYVRDEDCTDVEKLHNAIL